MDFNGIIQVSILIIFCVMAVNAARNRIESRNAWVPLAFGILITLTVDGILMFFNVFPERPLLCFGLILLGGTLLTLYLLCRPIIGIKPKE